MSERVVVTLLIEPIGTAIDMREKLRANEDTEWGVLARLREIEKAARAFWETTDDRPLGPLGGHQADMWDDLCDALKETI